MPAEIAENPFWRFSLALYEREDVPAACIDLQERLGLDVNLLLFCCWAGTRGRVLSGAEIAGSIATTAVWRDEVVRPLRAVRRWLKAQRVAPSDPAERLREDIKAAELAAEAIQQSLLSRALPLPKGPVAGGEASPDAVARNMRTYLAALGHAPEAADIADLSTVLRACCPALAPLDAIRLLEVRA